MSHAPREQLGPYELVAPLGSGGMGEVFRARDRRLGREVALKVLAPGASADPERLKRFEAEARAASALNHPNIVAVYDAGREGAEPFIVTELLEGQTLRERLAAGPLPPRKVVELGVQLARGLAAAHERGITHRDLKPENVFVTRDGQVRILDFGLAHMRRADGDEKQSGTLTHSGAVLGTAGYIAPEQLRGELADARADLFALGAILYELLSGERAFPGTSALERGIATLEVDPPGLIDRAPAVPPPLAVLVARCLEKAREDRFQGARDLAFTLEALSSGASGRLLPRPATASRASTPCSSTRAAPTSTPPTSTRVT